jgi:hypothetical protein
MKRKRFDVSIHDLARQLVAVKKEAKRLGIFTEDRELLKCPGCGLMEDVAMGGMLLMCRRSSPGVDTGLRFSGIRNKARGFRCPVCGAEFTATAMGGGIPPASEKKRARHRRRGAR